MYTYEVLGHKFLDTLGNIFHVNLLVHENWFMYIRVSHLKDYSISVYQVRYARSVVSKYLDTAILKENPKFYNTTLTRDMIST